MPKTPCASGDAFRWAKAALSRSRNAPDDQHSSIDLDAREPRFGHPVPRDSLVAARVVLEGAPVALILRPGRLTQIAEPVVGLHTVDVVDLCSRPLAVNYQPGNAVLLVGDAVDANRGVSAIESAGTITRLATAIGSFRPREGPSLRIVVQQLAGTLSRQFAHHSPSCSLSRALPRRLAASASRTEASCTGRRPFATLSTAR